MQKKTDMDSFEEWKDRVLSKMRSGNGKKYWFFAGIILPLVIVTVCVGASFYNYLHQQFFLERKANLIEINEKVAQMVDTVFRTMTTLTIGCESTMMQFSLKTPDEILDTVDYCHGMAPAADSAVLAFDQQGNYYYSGDRTVGKWQEPQMLQTDVNEVRSYICTVPHKNMDYMVFIKPLNEPVPMGYSGNTVTHVAVAREVASLKAVLAADVFQNAGKFYLVDQNGRILYRHIPEGEFMEGYNIVTTMARYKFLFGGTSEDLKQSLLSNTSVGFEFDYEGTPYYVASAPLEYNEWSVVLFVPEAVLGAETNLLLKTVVTYLAAIFVSLFLLLGILVFVILIGRNDKKLLAQEKEMNQMLTYAADMANSANAAKSEFLSHMSHDIRTPINGIMGMTDIALKHIDQKRRVEDCLYKINESSHHLLSLVNDVLDMSRIESGRVETTLVPMDIRQIAAACASIMEGRIVNREIRFVSDYEAIEHPLLIGDELHLRQCFINILGNAVKFTPDGGCIFFRVIETEADEEKASFRIEIEDSGIGMKPEFLEKIWEPFSQEDGGTRTTYQGTGLGMAITKKFVELMGGTISVESQLNVGSKFIMELSFAIDKTAQTEKETETAVSIKGMKILLVEDNELNLEIAQTMLEEEGAVITTAENGELAVEKFAASEAGVFDLILMDIMMPVMDGLEATRKIRAMEHPDAKTIPIVAMTANAFEEDMKKTREAGMNAHLSKPIEMTTVIKVLGNYKK